MLWGNLARFLGLVLLLFCSPERPKHNLSVSLFRVARTTELSHYISFAHGCPGNKNYCFYHLPGAEVSWVPYKHVMFTWRQTLGCCPPRCQLELRTNIRIHFYFSVHSFCLPPHLIPFWALYLWATLLSFSSPYLFSGRSCALWLSASIIVSRRGENQRKKGQGYLCYWFRVMPPVMPHTPETDCLNVASALLSDGLLAQLLRRGLVEIMWQVETRRVCWDFKWEVPFPHCQWWWHSSEKGGWGWHPGTHLKF